LNAASPRALSVGLKTMSDDPNRNRNSGPRFDQYN
jgi:hypothetical protein